ncbi:N-acetylmuramoyl-L-alanine amidase family protein [Neobacillus novalis]|uniref:N-acetylmuramoyl-L-alanine amidase family protein n=1 Tax=Neobacillus novalis TaxID=220687 RepID=A0AA95MRL8_9BACI|nr:N-acetylmuramoyl-L-alanine amidase family protein [Neobacillus novalis]WHY86031.1 N-acetylmuramoyl-L-alanine amidase family protein [Neobacillus novalis]
MKKIAKAFTLTAGLLLMASPTVSFANTTVSSSSKITSYHWLQKNGYWYYVNNLGDYSTGWKKINSKWYFFDKGGVMKTGWLLDNGKWYYFGKKGDMASGWVKDHSKWYYMERSGQMATGWRFTEFDHTYGWYYFKSSGAMASGWMKDGSESYYLLPDGRWAHNVIALSHFYQNNSIQYPGNELIKDNAELLKKMVSVGQTKDEVAKTLGNLYSVDSNGYYWEYSFLTPESGVLEPIKNGFTKLNPIELGQEKVSIKLLLSWDSSNRVKRVAIAYFSTDHRLHLYKQENGTKLDDGWTFGNSNAVD